MADARRAESVHRWREFWDGSAREADADELEALAERFKSDELRAAAARVRAAQAE
jgi:hypothetical protein